jgi:hypothetical protein
MSHSHVVRYRAPEVTETVKGKDTIRGSVHHAEIAEFTGIVTRSHHDGTHDIVIFPPGRTMVHLDRVKVGDGPGEIVFVTVVEPGPAASAATRPSR